MTERDRLDLRGLLPPNVMSPEQQIERFSKFPSATSHDIFSCRVEQTNVSYPFLVSERNSIRAMHQVLAVSVCLGLCSRA